jgi:PAS domain S-box-containing protein
LRFRLIAPVLLVLVLTAAGFVETRLDLKRDARRNDNNRADIAATEVRNGVGQAADLVEGFRRFMLGHGQASVSNAEFVDLGTRWLNPVGLTAAAWVQEVPTPGGRQLRAELVTGASPLTARGVDLSHTPAMAAAIAEPRTLFRVTATSLTRVSDGRSGVFLVESAPRLARGVLDPGYVVLFVPASWLFTTVTASTQETSSRLQLRVGNASFGSLGGAAAVSSGFSTAGRRFDVLVPQKRVHGVAAVLPWLVLGGGLVLALLTATLAAIAQRRARAQREVERIFRLSLDLITVAGFDGLWKRVNPAFETLLGYTEREAVGQPYLDFVHPADHQASQEVVHRIVAGEPIVAFNNRMVCKDGTYRWIEWTATPVLKEGLLYGVGRDVTERRRSESEQTALRRVATLVAESVQPEDIFLAVAEEVARVLDVPVASVVRYDADDIVTECASFSMDEKPVSAVRQQWSLEGTGVLGLVHRTGDVARIDDYSGLEGELAAAARRNRLRSSVGAPIVVGGRIWGAMVVSSRDEPLPGGTEARLADFTELLATAIAGAESQEARSQLADEQAALRRVATLVAQGVPPEELFAAVTDEVGQLLPVGSAAMGRLDADGMFTTVAAWSPGAAAFPVGKRWIPEGKNALTMVFETGRPARLDNFAEASGPIGVAAREAGYRSAVGTPIVVEGHLWGVMTAASPAEEPLPLDIDARLSSFTDLVATAIANAESVEARGRLAEQQAALRRVATLVAEGVQPPDLFAVMAEEIARVCDIEATSVVRYESGGAASELANFHLGSPTGLFPVGVRMNIEGVNILRLVRDRSKAARIDDYASAHGEMAEIVRRSGIRSSVGVPIIVGGRVWGAMVGSTTDPEPLPEDTASRMSDFTELLATAIENSDSREALERLAEEQAALRRMATLVAQGVQPAEIFSAVSDEIARLFEVDVATVTRFEHDQAIVFVGVAKKVGDILPVGTRWAFEAFEHSAASQVFRTGCSARVQPSGGPVAATAANLEVICTVASPILVEGRLWGTVNLASKEQLPADAEERLENFGDLVATAIANAESKSELAASRRRIVAASDQTRRQIERDLHDGTQQRLVSLELGLRAAEAELPPDKPELRAELSRVAGGLAEAVEELRELSRGIHPAILSEGGLGPALRTLARRSGIPVELDTQIDQRLPERLEVAAYYVASEALTNATKHAHASIVRIGLAKQNGMLRLSIRDDGIGGVDPARGSGVVGLQDRVEALGGKITIDSTPGIGTSLVATLPVDDEAACTVE